MEEELKKIKDIYESKCDEINSVIKERDDLKAHNKELQLQVRNLENDIAEYKRKLNAINKAVGEVK